MKNILRLLYLLTICICLHSLAANDRKLIFAVDILRHGDRGPIEYMPELSNAWREEELGQLTALGAQNAERLGQKMRIYYLGKDFSAVKDCNANFIYASTTNLQRTKETLEAALKGLCPVNYKNITIEESSLLRPNKELIKASKQKFFDEFSTNYSDKQLLATKIVTKINQVFDVNFPYKKLWEIGDLFYTSKIHSRPLAKKLDKITVNEAIKMRQFFLATYSNTAEPVCLYAKPFAEHLVNILESRQHQQKPSIDAKSAPPSFSAKVDNLKHNDYQYMVYTAHDYNISGIMSLFGSPLSNPPPYLANIRIEMFEQNGKILTEASLNNKQINVCGAHKPCPLSKFINNLKQSIAIHCK